MGASCRQAGCSAVVLPGTGDGPARGPAQAQQWLHETGRKSTPGRVHRSPAQGSRPVPGGGGTSGGLWVRPAPPLSPSLPCVVWPLGLVAGLAGRHHAGFPEGLPQLPAGPAGQPAAGEGAAAGQAGRPRLLPGGERRHLGGPGRPARPGPPVCPGEWPRQSPAHPSLACPPPAARRCNPRPNAPAAIVSEAAEGPASVPAEGDSPRLPGPGGGAGPDAGSEPRVRQGLGSALVGGPELVWGRLGETCGHFPQGHLQRGPVADTSACLQGLHLAPPDVHAPGASGKGAAGPGAGAGAVCLAVGGLALRDWVGGQAAGRPGAPACAPCCFSPLFDNGIRV